jgi:hypothetical protein
MSSGLVVFELHQRPGQCPSRDLPGGVSDLVWQPPRAARGAGGEAAPATSRSGEAPPWPVVTGRPGRAQGSPGSREQLRWC